MSCRYRLYPTSVQSEGLNGHCADARYVWNLALEQANHWRRGGGSTPNAAQRQRQLAEARGCSWLGDGSSSVQQQALRDFDQALRNWWGGSHRRPRWRRRGISEGFVVRDVKVRVLSRKWATLNVPKLGAVRFRLSRPMPDEHGMARVTLDRAGRWHVSFSAPQPPVEREPTGASIGVDLGVVATVATSDGERLSVPRLRQGERRRLRLLQRRMSRQRKGSNRRARTKHAIAVLRARETDRRKDWTEKVSTRLVHEYDLIAFEDLRVKSMMRSASGTVEKPGRNVAQKRGLNRSIAAQGWSRFVLRTEQKAAASGVACLKVPAAFSSQTCGECGVVDAASRRSQSAFRCAACGHAENADVNAAQVVHARGLRVSARGGPLEVGAPVEARTVLDVAA